MNEPTRARRVLSGLLVRLGRAGLRADPPNALLLIAALAVVTCAHGSLAPVRSPSAAPSAARQGELAVPAAAPSGIASPAPAVPPSRLAAFFAALGELGSGSRREPVRVLWFGDSHTAADFWTHRLRLALQARFGTGGPGFVHLGLKGYRNGAAHVEIGGNWRALPLAPSYFVGQQGDGVYGLSGMLAIPKTEQAWTSVQAANGSLEGRARWQVIYRLPSAKSRFDVELSSGERLVVDQRAGKARPSGLHQVEIESEANATLRIASGSVAPELFGVVVEGSEPGVVVDTLGINGARIATPLTWDEASFVAEARERNPSLVVFAYGTNEVGDELAAWHYGEHLATLVGRLRAAVANVACLIVGPTDRAGPDWESLPRVTEVEHAEREAADRLGCEFFSTLDAMGGIGSLKAWAFASPPLALKDHVHLTVRGYGVLGDALANKLLADYDASRLPPKGR